MNTALPPAVLDSEAPATNTAVAIHPVIARLLAENQRDPDVETPGRLERLALSARNPEQVRYSHD